MWGPALVLASQLGDQVISFMPNTCNGCFHEKTITLSTLILFVNYFMVVHGICLQFYVDTVKQMALHQLVPGSPLRTLCLLIAGQPAEVFCADSGANGNISNAQVLS